MDEPTVVTVLERELEQGFYRYEVLLSSGESCVVIVSGPVPEDRHTTFAETIVRHGRRDG